MTVDVWRAYIYSQALGASQLDGVCWHTYLTSFLLWSRFSRVSPLSQTRFGPFRPIALDRDRNAPRVFIHTMRKTSAKIPGIWHERDEDKFTSSRDLLLPNTSFPRETSHLSRLFGGWTIARFLKGMLTRMNQHKLENEILLFTPEF